MSTDPFAPFLCPSYNLAFLEAHRWKLGRKWPDVYSRDFEMWCDYVARENCAALADDANLIGYYFTDVPLLVNKSDRYPAKDTIHDPELLKTPAGRAKIAKDTRQYYQVACDAIRRYDTNHLIFGDRYNLATPTPRQLKSPIRPVVFVLTRRSTTSC